MLCEECGERDALFAVSVKVGDQTTVRHLCGECMSRLNPGLQAANINTLLSTIIAAIHGRASAPQESAPVPDITCPRCGMTWKSYTRTGRLGCPGCYEAFREQLQPALQQIHGHVQHAGRRPLQTADAQRTRSLQEELSRQMTQAIALEDFETAAVLRDRLHALAGKEAPAE